MTKKKKAESVIAVCVQEPLEDGSAMNLGAIEGDNLKFLHQAFITDTIRSALTVEEADVRFYSADTDERKRFVKIVTEYLGKKLSGKLSLAYKDRFSQHEQKAERWGVKINEVFEDCFEQGYRNVLVIGSRTPTITPAMISTALKLLGESDAVFGPTPEGRYYVVGMSKKAHINLSEFDWKSASIYNEVSSQLDEKKLSWAELEIWYAIESADELELMARDINQYRFEGDEQIARETEVVIERLLSKLET